MNTQIELPPIAIETPSAWIGSELKKKKNEWLTHFSDDEIIELESAASNFLSSEKNIGEIRKSDFPLPKLRLFIQHNVIMLPSEY